MAREKETFRLELEQINLRFGGKAVLTCAEASAYTGHCYRWCAKHLGVSKDGITAVMLAHRLSSL